MVGRGGTDRRTGARRIRGRRLVAVPVVVVMGVWAASGGPGAAAEETGAPIISVSRIPATVALEPCGVGIRALRYETVHTATSFTLRILSPSTPCSPVAAVAVAYRMPDQGAWPQTLAERRDVVVDRAGVTEARFAKGCVPLQFDVVTGATPDTIAPWAAWHGQLLFPGDLRTAFQYRPTADCSTTTTTAPPPTVEPTTSVAPSSTTVPTTGPPTTGSIPEDGEPTTTAVPPPSVLGQTQSPSTTEPEVLDTSVGAPGTPRVAGLALTGTSVRILVIAGIVTMLIGLVMLAGARRRVDA